MLVRVRFPDGWILQGTFSVYENICQVFEFVTDSLSPPLPFLLLDSASGARLDQEDCYFRSISVDLQRKRDYLAKVLTEVGMKPVIPEGGYFMMADWSQLADKVDLSSETDAARDYRFTKWLSKNKKLQGIPPSAFFCQDHKSIGENFIRFCFIKHDDSLKKAEEILQTWRKELN